MSSRKVLPFVPDITTYLWPTLQLGDETSSGVFNLLYPCLFCFRLRSLLSPTVRVALPRSACALPLRSCASA